MGPASDFTAPDIAVTRGALLSPSRPEVESALRAEGLEPTAWANGGDFSYGRHAHDHHKVLVCVSGAIVFHAQGGDVALAPGDRIDLPAGVEHGATVGHEGVECVEAFRP